jgi:MFS transporter, DHA2 family, multidrug resistance protein
LLWPVILSGSAAGMVFVPLSTTAMATLSNERIGSASGLYNLLRNIGGSIGIAITNTIIARHEQIHRAELARYISRTGPFDRAFAALRSVMVSHAGPRLTDSRSYALIQNGLEQQAAVYSYVDVFRYFTLVCILCAPLIFLVRRARAKQGAAAGAH